MSMTTLEGFGGRVALQVPMKALMVSCGLALAIVGVLTWSLMTGSYPMTSAEVWATLFGDPPSDTASTVVWEFRFPRTLVAFIVGAFLALSGAALQYVTRNPLADPSLVGVSQGAALVVVSVTILAPTMGYFWRPMLAFGGSLTVAAIILAAASSHRGGETLRFILMGIGVAALISSFTQALLTYGDIDRAMSALGWLAGSVHSVGWDEVRWLTATACIVMPALFFAARPLSAIRFGEDVATGLGIRVRVARWGLVILAVSLAATAVAAVGPLGFVGLVAPHLARRLAHSGVGLHLVLTALTGALMVGLADFAGRAAFAPIQIPAGLVTAIIGVPVLVFLILRTQARSQL
ncbi:iron ABC transporter permease [Cognatiyoonia sp. IB215182]|uniref:FecCD family ABC transporter permease n=1 Tax=Cognatiyoonia sp. IB215182 TaxID=3097353 RepID=UPI002A0C9598|nr:iron ABC transporter permease [Cognatiyoonia sp. IB215182]MDX8354776.1 iron ABC transporter permease [Cognatiyoonia sp. IB215182]